MCIVKRAYALEPYIKERQAGLLFKPRLIWGNIKQATDADSKKIKRGELWRV
jgi:hypothetical protein